MIFLMFHSIHGIYLKNSQHISQHIPQHLSFMLLYDFPFAQHSPFRRAETAPKRNAPTWKLRLFQLALDEWPNSSSGSSSLWLKSQSTTTIMFPPHSSGHCHLQGVLNPKAPRWSVSHRILPERILLQVEDAQWFVVELLTMIIRCNDYKLGYPRLQTNPCEQRRGWFW